MLNATAIIVTHTYIHIFNTHSPTSKCTTTKTTTIKKERERKCENSIEHKILASYCMCDAEMIIIRIEQNSSFHFERPKSENRY